LLHAKSEDRIVGSSELGFGVGFDRLHDDMPLGYYVNKKPDLIIWNSRYQAWCDSMRGTAAGDYVRNRKAEFEKAFETGEFQVYVPRSQNTLVGIWPANARFCDVSKVNLTVRGSR
jgi:hypothetical protein